MGYLGLILAVLLAPIFFYFGKQIHKHEYKVYGVSLFVSVVLVFLIILNVNVQQIPLVYPVVYTGHLGFALFTLVMLGGAFKKKTKPKILIMRIRREMAILGFISLLPHAFLRLDLALSGFNYTGLMAMLIIAPLVVTSLPKVRKKMHPYTWKKVHYAAYLVYALIYSHLVFDLYTANGVFNVSLKSTGLVYLFVFIVYLGMKAYVIMSEKKPKSV